METHCFTARDSLGNTYEFEKQPTDCGILLTLQKEKIKEVSNIFALGDFTKAHAGDEGYYVLPRNIQQIADILTEFEEREDCFYKQTLPIMSVFGMKKKNMCCLIRVARDYNISFAVSVRGGEYTGEVVFEIEEDYIAPQQKGPASDIKIELVFLDAQADYNDMAKAERELRLRRGEITPLWEKCKREAVAYACQYPLIRIRQGWKQSPSPIKHQTPETEPPLQVVCDFKRCREIADECKRQGVTGAEFQLVGWSIGGHDGRFPQLFPVEERLGGMEEYKKTVAHIKALGYRISTHTNLQDAYEIAENFSYDDLAKDRDGSHYIVGDFCSGIAYYLCETVQAKNSRTYYPALAALGENGLHFTDVMSITIPHACHHPSHPLTFKQACDLRLQSMHEQRELFGAFSSEGCFDYTMKDLDYGLYVCFGDAFGHSNTPIISKSIRFWEVTYHGTLLYNPESGTINYAIKTPEDHLRFVMSGGRPSFYFYSKFRTGGETNWMGEEDLTCGTEEELRSSVAAIRAAQDEYETLQHLQQEYIDRYDILDNGIEKVTYANGTCLIGNFNHTEIVFEGETIKPFSYLLRQK